ncbi:MAG: DUF2478 domain-containing protein [Stappiaceae bacterium]
MKIAWVSSPSQGETDRLLAETAAKLREEGVGLSGIVKVLDHIATAENGCEMKVRVLPEGPIVQITQDLGRGSNACRLDPGALASAVSLVQNAGLDGTKLFILNKFGPEEATGRGFCDVIGAALEQEIPVLVGVGASHEAFNHFADGMAEELKPDQEAIYTWCQSAITESGPAQ